MTWLGDVALSKASVQDLGRVLIGQGQWNRVECGLYPVAKGWPLLLTGAWTQLRLQETLR